MSLKKRLILFLLVSGLILSVLLYYSHNISEIPFLQTFVDSIFNDNYTGVMVFSFVAVGILGIMVYLFINKYINRRLLMISGQMKKIQGLKDLSMRIHHDNSKDEIAALILEINDTLDKLEKERIDKEQLEKMLVTNEKLVSVGRLSASIAHEIHNPILAISNCFQALKKRCGEGQNKDSDLFQQALQVSETEINRIRNIISNLLDFHRLEREAFSRVDLGEVIQQSLEILKWGRKLGSTKVETKRQGDFFILGSPGKLKQVFINFILNSVEANSREKGKIRIEILPSADRNRNFCEVHFMDNGPGISPQIKNKLFEPFVSTKEDKGVGLGLYVSYKIIENHHGEIVYDDTYKEGAYFIIKLPVIESVG